MHRAAAAAANRVANGFVHADGQHERRLAHGFGAKDVVLAVGLGPQVHLEVFGHVARGGDFVSAWRMRAQMPLAVPNQLLTGQPAHALHKTALDLADVQRRVDAAPDVVQDVYLEHPRLAGQGVDGHLGAGGAVSEVEKRPAGERGFVVMDFGRAVKAITPQLNAVGIGGLHHVLKTARVFGRAHLPAAKLHSACATAVQAGHKSGQVVAHMAGGKLGGAAIKVGTR